MTHNQRSNKPPETPQTHLETPSRFSLPSTARISKNTISKRTASPRVSASKHPRKKAPLFGSHAQSTLTQIDFVTQTTQPDDQEELQYLDGDERPNTKHNESKTLNENSDDDTEYKPPLQARSARSTFESNDDHPKRRRKSATQSSKMTARGESIRKSQTPRASAGPKGKRKSTEKSDNKTLTQMHFVRRFIPIVDDDDDVNLGYLSTEHSVEKIPKGLESKNPRIKERLTPTSVKRTRRALEAELDLSTGEPISDPGTSQAAENGSVSHEKSNPKSPMTPRHPKFEVPSSQSPESPGLAIITSSQFRSATRSPLKRKSPNSAHYSQNRVKGEPAKSPQLAKDHQCQVSSSPGKTPRASLPRGLTTSTQNPATFAEELALCGASDESTNQRSNDQEPPRTQGERTVVYETDAETNQSDSEYDLNEIPGTPSRVQESQVENTHEQDQNSEPLFDDESQELPLPGDGFSSNLDDGPQSEAPMSDASLYYQRLPATQFPHEPIPTLNTQKLSELFPSEGATQYTKFGSGSAHKPDLSYQKFPGPFLQSQTQSQEGEEPEIVPESSPAREQDVTTEASQVVFQRPHVPASIVQVESSQPVERGDDAGAGRLLSRSQLLTSSVMESVPLPNFWMGSQDSVGEPYSI
ncbi:uncharacterized protein N7483_008830 [Penicillium malachiteum]|uniref:uncharacterized protein n=1 Tax=Penicillium malachiteum TaxID=1324776 RepID=UPI00254722E5|nr:uncharacterized protein N7483_008830 [Penicillium malachiteum]KAJ5720896.1 hypothetical protein N7483_008830 [Penicillium malachiteum]